MNAVIGVKFLVALPKNILDKPLTVEQNLKHLAARETAEIQQSSAEAVHELTGRQDQYVKLGKTVPCCTMLEPSLPTGAARYCLDYTPSIPSEDNALQDIARSEVEKPAWVNIKQNHSHRAEAKQNVSSRQELKKG